VIVAKACSPSTVNSSDDHVVDPYIQRRYPDMSVGLLLMTHEAVGQALISAAHHVMPKLPLQVAAVEIPPQSDPDVMRTLTVRYARELDQGDGVLVLADLYGATPCNIGLSLSALGVRLRCVSGLNLPMLLRVLNYAEKPLDELAEIAASGGRGGIFIDHA
jgi:PTS system ascorbate-specific IIA component